MTSNVPALVNDPGRPGMPRLAARYLRSEFQLLVKRILHRAGLDNLHPVLPEQWAIPDSDFAIHAIEYARLICPAYMVDHCFRSYYFGAILAARNRIELDREVFFVAAMLHDLGLSERHECEPASFEWVSAGLACEYSKREGQPDFIAAMVHNAIALHTSVGIAGSREPEIALLHFGTGMDLFGMRLHEVPGELLEEVLARHPRTDFRETFGGCLARQAKIKPQSQIAAAVDIGICNKIREQLSPV